MRRLLHKLFARHNFEPYELLLPEPHTFNDPLPQEPRIWYVGYHCRCGEPGYAVPLEPK